MKKYCWVYFKNGYGLCDVRGVFLDHQKGLEFVADDLIKGNPTYKDLPLHRLYEEANADLHKQEILG